MKKEKILIVCDRGTIDNKSYSTKIEPKNAILLVQFESCSLWYCGERKTNATWRVKNRRRHHLPIAQYRRINELSVS